MSNGIRSGEVNSRLAVTRSLLVIATALTHYGGAVMLSTGSMDKAIERIAGESTTAEIAETRRGGDAR